MKKFLGLTLVSILSISGSTGAASIYSFNGNVTSIDDGTGIIGATGLAIGDSVTYEFLVDTNLPGTITRNNGDTVIQLDPPNFSNLDYFYADLISGSIIDEIDGGSYNNSNDVAEYNYGWENITDIDEGLLIGGSRDNHVVVRAPLDFSDWTIGLSLVGYERAYGQNFINSDAIYSLELTSITPAPIPLPAAAWLFGSGVMGLLGFNYRRKRI
ncbi:MAG: hypothetical protein AB2754_20005 [Candidatus Thiodiazotropha endolucinida]